MSKDATLAILAGGAGSRMGRPKAEIELNGRPILRHLLSQIAWQGPTMLVTSPGRTHPPACEDFHREVVDPIAGQGPLRGVLTALENAATPLVVCATVDMPMVQGVQLLWLVSAIRAHPDRSILMLRRGGQIEPFPSAYRAGASDGIAKRLNASRRDVRGLVELPESVVIDAPADWDASIWVNLNTPADLRGLVNSG